MNDDTKCKACEMEAEIGTEDIPHPIDPRVHSCVGEHMDKPVDSYETFRNALREALSKIPDADAISFGPDIAVAAFDELLSLKEQETLANDALLAKEIIRRLNRLIENKDVRKDLSDLIENRIPCTDTTLRHPTIQTQTIEGSPHIGFLGMLNGIVGVIPEGPRQGYGYIAGTFDGPDNEDLTGFRTTAPVEKTK